MYFLCMWRVHLSAPVCNDCFTLTFIHTCFMLLYLYLCLPGLSSKPFLLNSVGNCLASCFFCDPSLSVSVCMYIYTHTHIHICVFIYMCTCRERERERERVKTFINGTWMWWKTVFSWKLPQYLGLPFRNTAAVATVVIVVVVVAVAAFND